MSSEGPPGVASDCEQQDKLEDDDDDDEGEETGDGVEADDDEEEETVPCLPADEELGTEPYLPVHVRDPQPSYSYGPTVSRPLLSIKARIEGLAWVRPPNWPPILARGPAGDGAAGSRRSTEVGDAPAAAVASAATPDPPSTDGVPIEAATTFQAGPCACEAEGCSECGCPTAPQSSGAGVSACGSSESTLQPLSSTTTTSNRRESSILQGPAAAVTFTHMELKPNPGQAHVHPHSHHRPHPQQQQQQEQQHQAPLQQQEQMLAALLSSSPHIRRVNLMFGGGPEAAPCNLSSTGATHINSHTPGHTITIPGIGPVLLSPAYPSHSSSSSHSPSPLRATRASAPHIGLPYIVPPPLKTHSLEPPQPVASRSPDRFRMPRIRTSCTGVGLAAGCGSSGALDSSEEGASNPADVAGEEGVAAGPQGPKGRSAAATAPRPAPSKPQIKTLELNVPPKVLPCSNARRGGCNRNNPAAAGGGGGGFGGGGGGGGFIPPLARQGSCAAFVLQEASEPSLSPLHQQQQQQPSPHRPQHYTHPALLHRGPQSHGSLQPGPDEAVLQGEAEAQCPDPFAPVPGGVSPVRGACVEGGGVTLARSRSSRVAVVHMSLDLDLDARQHRQARQRQLVRGGAGGVSMSGLVTGMGAEGEGRGLGGVEDGIASGRDSRVGPVSPCEALEDLGEDALSGCFALPGGRRGSEPHHQGVGGPGAYGGGLGPPCPPAVTGPGRTTPDDTGSSMAHLMQLRGAERARPGPRRPVHAHRQLRAPHPALDAVQQTSGTLARHQPCAAGVTLSVPAPPAAMGDAAAVRLSCPQLPTAEPMPNLRRGVHAAAAAAACSPPPPLRALKPQQGGRAARLYGGGEGDPGGRHSGGTGRDSLFMQSVAQHGASIGGLWDNVPGVGVGAAAGTCWGP